MAIGKLIEEGKEQDYHKSCLNAILKDLSRSHYNLGTLSSYHLVLEARCTMEVVGHLDCVANIIEERGQ